MAKENNIDRLNIDQETENRMREMWQNMMFFEQVKRSADQHDQQEAEGNGKKRPGSKQNN